MADSGAITDKNRGFKKLGIALHANLDKKLNSIFKPKKNSKGQKTKTFKAIKCSSFLEP